MPSGLLCSVAGHRWRRVLNDRGEDCDYCPSCGCERHVRGPAAVPVVRPPSPSWPVRRMSVWLGRRTPLPPAFAMSRLVDHLELGRWLRTRGLQPGRGSGGREEVQDVAMSLAAGRHLLYLEFGVYRGASLRRWSQTVTDPDAHFVGFDSFEGLPEDWLPEVRTGHFSTGGQIPSFRDPRVRLVPGWFEETVPQFALPEHDLLVINIDCDLYSSARAVLTEIAPHVVAGTLLYFDELSYASGELRALEEFLQTTGVAVQVVARSDNWAHWLFRVLPSERERRPRSEVPAPRAAALPSRLRQEGRRGVALTVHVVVDRDDRKRAEFWSQALENVRKNRNLDLEWRLQPLPDLLAAPLTDEPVFLEQLKDGDVLVVNWDAINDDLDFGADRSLRWFHQRQGILHRWVAEGGILLLEGQASWGVPMQECYDAVLGANEVLVCGAEDARKPDLQLRRSVGDCRMTSIARSAAGFENLDEIAPRVQRTQDDMFPPTTAGRLVGWSLKEDGWDWGRSLYRGWFRRDLWPRRTAHTWVTYVRRKERWPNAHPTLKVARLGEGAIFASTMLLASTGQEQLITAILRTHGRADRLPEPGIVRRELSRRVVAGVSALLTGLLAFFLTSGSGLDRVVITAAVGTGVAVTLYLLPQLYRALVRLLRGITGN